MKTKLLLPFLCMFMMSLHVSAQNEISIRKAKLPARSSKQVATDTKSEINKLIYAFCGDEVEASAGVEIDAELRAYIRIPAKQWKGAAIKEVKIGMGYEAGKDSYVFISKDLEKDPVVKQYYRCDTISPVPDGEDYLLGWKTVPLETPYIIDSDDDLFIGWYTVQQGFNPFGIDWNEPLIDGNTVSFRRAGETDWTYQKLDHNVSIKIWIEGDNLPQNHLRVANCSVDNKYIKKGADVTISGTIINEGILPVESFDVTYGVSDEEMKTVQIRDLDLAPMQRYSFSYQVPVLNEGKKTAVLTASKPNGKEDEYAETTTATSEPFGCLAKGLQKNVIVEEVVGTDDTGAEAADLIIQDAINRCERKENVIRVNNHCISKDEYSITGYKNYQWCFYDRIFTPAVNIDHTRIPGTWMADENGKKVEALTEMFLIDENFGEHLETSLNDEEVYFSMDVECEVIDEDVLKIKMQCLPALEGLFPDIEQPSIALILLEDSIEGKQAGVDGKYIHNNVPRAFINDGKPEYAYLGDEIPIPDEGLTLETKYVIRDKSWNINNLRLVFYLMDANVAIRNSASCFVKPRGTGIKDHKADSDLLTVRCEGGWLHINGEFDKAYVLSMSGQKVLTVNEADTGVSGLAKGIYCILIQKGNRFVSEKFLVR